MFRWLLERSLRHRAVVLALAGLTAFYGLWTAAHARLDVLPDFAPAQAEVQTEAPGLSADEVERLVTLPVEASLGGVPGLEALRSESIQGLSAVTAVFSDGTDLFRARQLVAEALSEVGPALPAGVQPPRLSPLTSATMDVLTIGLTSEALSPMDLRTLAESTLRPRLLMVPGVARVNVFGGETRQIQVRARPALLRAHGVALSDLLRAARSATATARPGFIDTPNQRIVLEASNLGSSPAEIGEALVASRGAGALRLRDVAEVVEGAAPRVGDALIDGHPGVLLSLSSAWGANTVEVTRGLERALADLEPVLRHQEVTLHRRLHRPADFVDAALRNLRTTLALSSVLVALVLLAFLRDPRAAAVSLAAIPLSLLAAVIVLQHLGSSLNTMSLGGLAIAIGEVVDDAIIDVENILRRLRENERQTPRASRLAVVLRASLEIRGSVVFASLAVATIFLPLLQLSDLQGKFFAPLASSYLLAVAASLGVALTVTPALTLALFARRDLPEHAPSLQERLRAGHRRLLERIERRPLLAWIPALALAAAALGLLPFLGGEFLPTFQENHLVLHVVAAPGTSLDEMRRIGQEISAQLLALPGVRSVAQQIGRAEAGEDTWGPNQSEFQVELRPGEDGDVTAAEIRHVLDATTGVQAEVETFLGDRISETLTGETAQVVVDVFGEDLDRLDREAARAAKILASISGAADVRWSEPAWGPRVAVGLRPERLRLLGFDPAEVLDQLRIAFAGASAGTVMRGEEPVQVVATLPPAERRSPADVGALLVTSASGNVAPLDALARVSVREGRDVIRHAGGIRRQTVTCNVRGRDVASFAAEARERLSRRLELPGGDYFVLGGAAEARTRAVRDLWLHAGLGLLGILLVLSVPAGHWRNLLLLLAGAPFALAGGLLAAALASWAGGGAPSLSLGSLVGLVTVFGITTRNALMLLSHYRHLVEEEGRPWDRETMLAGAADRVVPVAMTAGVAILALLPLAFRSHEAGGEIDGPMAIVILGGIAVAALSNLAILPWLSLRYGRIPAPAERPAPE